MVCDENANGPRLQYNLYNNASQASTSGSSIADITEYPSNYDANETGTNGIHYNQNGPNNGGSNQKLPKRVPTRYILVIMGFLAFVNMYMMYLNMTVAWPAMVNHNATALGTLDDKKGVFFEKSEISKELLQKHSAPTNKSISNQLKKSKKRKKKEKQIILPLKAVNVSKLVLPPQNKQNIKYPSETENISSSIKQIINNKQNSSTQRPIPLEIPDRLRAPKLIINNANKLNNISATNSTDRIDNITNISQSAKSNETIKVIKKVKRQHKNSTKLSEKKIKEKHISKRRKKRNIQIPTVKVVTLTPKVVIKYSGSNKYNEPTVKAVVHKEMENETSSFRSVTSESSSESESSSVTFATPESNLDNKASSIISVTTESSTESIFASISSVIHEASSESKPLSFTSVTHEPIANTLEPIPTAEVQANFSTISHVTVILTNVNTTDSTKDTYENMSSKDVFLGDNSSINYGEVSTMLAKERNSSYGSDLYEKIKNLNIVKKKNSSLTDKTKLVINSSLNNSFPTSKNLTKTSSTSSNLSSNDTLNSNQKNISITNSNESTGTVFITNERNEVTTNKGVLIGSINNNNSKFNISSEGMELLKGVNESDNGLKLSGNINNLKLNAKDPNNDVQNIEVKNETSLIKGQRVMMRPVTDVKTISSNKDQQTSIEISPTQQNFKNPQVEEDSSSHLKPGLDKLLSLKPVDIIRAEGLQSHKQAITEESEKETTTIAENTLLKLPYNGNFTEGNSGITTSSPPINDLFSLLNINNNLRFSDTIENYNSTNDLTETVTSKEPKNNKTKTESDKQIYVSLNNNSGTKKFKNIETVIVNEETSTRLSIEILEELFNSDNSSFFNESATESPMEEVTTISPIIAENTSITFTSPCYLSPKLCALTASQKTAQNQNILHINELLAPPLTPPFTVRRKDDDRNEDDNEKGERESEEESEESSEEMNYRIKSITLNFGKDFQLGNCSIDPQKSFITDGIHCLSNANILSMNIMFDDSSSSSSSSEEDDESEEDDDDDDDEDEDDEDDEDENEENDQEEDEENEENDEENEELNDEAGAILTDDQVKELYFDNKTRLFKRYDTQNLTYSNGTGLNKVVLDRKIDSHNVSSYTSHDKYVVCKDSSEECEGIEEGVEEEAEGTEDGVEEEKEVEEEEEGKNTQEENEPKVGTAHRTDGLITLDDEKVPSTVCFYRKKASTNFNGYEDGEFTWEPETLNSVTSAYYWGFLVSQIIAGRLTSLFGGKKVLVQAILFAGFITCFTPLLAKAGLYWLITSRVLLGMMLGLVMPAIQTLLAKWSPPLERTKMVAYTYSGIAIGAAMGGPLSAYLVQKVGWRVLFIGQGIMAILWCILFLLLIVESPGKHKRISAKEKQYILTSIGQQHAQKGVPTPWCSIIKCRHVFSLMLAQGAFVWAWHSLLHYAPLYIASVLHEELSDVQNVWAAALCCMFVMSCVYGTLADWARKSRKTSTITIRRAANSICSIVTAAFLVGVAQAYCNTDAVKVCFALAIAMGIPGALCGIFPNSLDLAPNHAAAITGLSGAFATSANILAPYYWILIVFGQSTLERWRTIWYTSAIFLLLANCLYFLLVGTREQRWNRPVVTSKVPRRREEPQPRRPYAQYKNQAYISSENL